MIIIGFETIVRISNIIKGKVMSICKEAFPILSVIFLISVFVLVSCVAPKVKVSAGVTEWRLQQFEVSPPSQLTKTGNPRIVDSPYGKAMEFNGKEDAFFLEINPLLGLNSFSIEAIIRPDADGPKEQRFLHIGEPHGDRMLLETRLTDDGQWCLDSYLQSGRSQKALLDRKLLHPAGKWYHVALVVDNGKMTSYVNGKPELEGEIEFTSIKSGKTSIGVRMNKVSWYKGAIYKILITQSVLKPEEFTMQ